MGLRFSAPILAEKYSISACVTYRRCPYASKSQHFPQAVQSPAWALWLDRVWSIHSYRRLISAMICPSSLTCPPLLLLLLFVYLLHTEEFTSINAGAGLSLFVPGMGTFKIRSPEWPCTALVGPHGVDSAAFFTVLRVQKDTILGMWVFDDGRAIALTPEILPANLVLGEL